MHLKNMQAERAIKMEPKVLLTIRILEEYMQNIEDEKIYNALEHATMKLRELFNFDKENY